MSQLVEELKKHLRNNKAQLIETNEIIQKAKSRLVELSDRRANYLLTLIAELNAEELFDEVRKLEQEENLLTIDISLPVESNAEFILNFVQDRGKTGAKPADIVKAFEKTNRGLQKNSIYALIMRLKRKGRLREEDRRYYIGN